MPIEELIKQAIKGNRSSQAKMFQQLSPKMMGVCVRYMPNIPDAQDVLQDAFVKVFQNLSGFNFNGSFEGWVRRIVINTALEALRKNHALKWSEDIDSFGHFESQTENAIEYLSKKELLGIIQKIPTGYKTVFNLFAIEGYSHKEIATLLNISEGTSKSQFSRARKHIQIELINQEKYLSHERR